MNRLTKVGVLGTSLLLSLTIFSASAKAADYTIINNDSLYKIGDLFNSDVDTLKSMNDLNTDIIYPGQIIDVPATAYKVKNGDNLFNIALQNNISLETLRKANNKWDDLILPGEILLIPTSNGSTKTYTANNPKVENNISTPTTNNSSKTSNTTNTNNSSKANNSSKTNNSSKAVISYTEDELDLLARLITAEATGQPYNAMVSVGSVVVNRVQSNQFPSSIKSVIYEVSGGYYQFTPVKNGYINKPASSEALKAAKEALTGADPSNGALFFFDDSSTSDWLWSKDITARYDDMIFVK